MASLNVGDTSTRASPLLLSLPESTILLHEDEYVNEFLMKATPVLEEANERRNIDIEMGGNDEDSIQYRDIMYIH